MKIDLRGTQNQPSIVEAAARFRRFAALFPSERFFVHLIVYADESGHHDATGKRPGSSTPIIVGVAGTEKQWEEFYGDWQRILNAYSVPFFHFTEWASACAASRGARRKTSKDIASPYAHLTHDRLNRLFSAICKLIGSTKFVFVGGSIFIHVAPETADAPTPLHEVANAFFNGIVRDIRSGRPNWNGTVDVIFDEPDKTWRNIVTDAFFEARKSFTQLKNLSFGSDTHFLGIQVADVLACRLRQQCQNYTPDGLEWDLKENDKLLFKSMSNQFTRKPKK